MLALGTLANSQPGWVPVTLKGISVVMVNPCVMKGSSSWGRPFQQSSSMQRQPLSNTCRYISTEELPVSCPAFLKGEGEDDGKMLDAWGEERQPSNDTRPQILRRGKIKGEIKKASNSEHRGRHLISNRAAFSAQPVSHKTISPQDIMRKNCSATEKKAIIFLNPYFPPRVPWD